MVTTGLAPAKEARDSRRLACPFHIFDPVKYGVHQTRRRARNTRCDYRTCSGPGFRSIQRLKEHLKRIHTPVQCERCFTSFEGTNRVVCLHQLADHRQQKVPCERGDPAQKTGISDAQWLVIKQRSPRNQEENRIKAWYRIWEIVFPKMECPKAPWYTTPVHSPVSPEAMDSKAYAQVFLETLALTGRYYSPNELDDLENCAQVAFSKHFAQAPVHSVESIASISPEETGLAMPPTEDTRSDIGSFQEIEPLGESPVKNGSQEVGELESSPYLLGYPLPANIPNDLDWAYISGQLKYDERS